MRLTRLIAFAAVMLLHALVVVVLVLSTQAVRYIAGEPMRVQFVSDASRTEEFPRPRPPSPVLVQPVLQVTEAPSVAWQVEVPPESTGIQPAVVGSAAPATLAAESVESATQPELAAFCPERPPPSYPGQSRRLREQGEVTLQVVLDETGRVAQADIIRGSGFARLDEAARSTVMSWRCNPAMRDGRTVRTVAMQIFEFILKRR